MSYEEETEYVTGSFRCIDPIQNFKVRVVLKPMKSRFIPVPHYEKVKEVDASGSPVEYEEAETGEDYIFSWQEKVFSKSEIAKYSDLSNCKTELHERYHEIVTKMSNQSNNQYRKLFTYVDGDNYKMKSEDMCPILGGRTYMSLLAKQIDNLEISCSSVKNYKNVSKNKIVNYSPNNDFKKQNHLINTSNQKMFIMVDFSEANKKNGKSDMEYVLCIITYDSVSKVIKVTPSFSKEIDNKPYIIGSNGQYSRNAYYYWLHHASLVPTEENLSNEKRIRTKILQHQNEIRKLQIGNEFFSQSPSHVNVMILGEIVSAQDFEYDSLCIHYLTNLPNGWHCSEPETLMGMTHIARSNDSGTAHFCHLFTMEVMFDLKHLEDLSVHLPEIFFEVLSVDRWKIFRNEGYARITLPRKPGMHNFTLRCWRATGNSIREELDRFFLGGSQVLEDVSYAGMGNKNENKRVMSRFGFKTTPSGNLEVRLNIIHQSEAFKSETDKKSEIDSSIFGRFSTSNLLGSVNAVLEAFRQARERMLKAKETLESEPD